MPKVMAMIPVLLGSTRVPDKNILLVDGRVLCSYTIDACRQSGVFADIWLNSEDGIFRTIAEKEQASFYQRRPEFGGRKCEQNTKSRNCAGARCVINDHYLYDFMKNGPEADYVCQVNSTSPLLKPETIQQFVAKLVEGQYDSLFAVHGIKAESLFQEQPINFDRHRKHTSQELEPIDSICWAIAGWRREKFLETFERNDPAEDGPVFGGKLGAFPIPEHEALDIDEWSTLELIEKLLIERRTGLSREWRYLDGRTITP